jgi:hypothetical protein
MYGKVFEQLYESTLATKGPWEAMALWPHLIAMANRHGEVDMPMEIISRKTTIPLEIVKAAIDALSQPDPDSRSQECGGRRIVLIAPESRQWGWRLVNYARYAAMRNEEERREYQREWVKNKRHPDGNGQESTGVDSRQVSTKSTYTDADKVKNTVSSDEDTAAGFEEFWQAYPACVRKVNKRGCLSTWKSRKLGRCLETILDGLACWKRYEGWTREHDNLIPLPATFLNQDRWLTPPTAVAERFVE